jgi:hypothetical protein
MQSSSVKTTKLQKLMWFVYETAALKISTITSKKKNSFSQELYFKL